MVLLINNDKYKYELENILQLFFPDEKIIVTNESDNPQITAFESITDKSALLTVSVDFDVYKRESKREVHTDDNRELELAKMLYLLLRDYTGLEPQWGMQTGIRPVKLLRSLINNNSKAFAEDYFKNKLFVSDKKYKLASETLINEDEQLKRLKLKSFSLYVSIPFCPSRCSYCSFISHDVNRIKKLVPDYVNLLCEELKLSANIARKLGLTLQTIYFGGGTPTSLDSGDLTKLFNTIKENFILSELDEYTVEAGRPDTLSKEKLKALQNGGVTRISINPQTLNDDVLKAIGRNHTAEDTIKAFSIAREYGFNNINADIIAGLPTDTYESFMSTVDNLLKIEPESITVHTLSLKRASTLVSGGTAVYSAEGKNVGKMLDYSYDNLLINGYKPYYLYRQSRMLGNLENVGYAKKGYESLYNVYIMDECQTIIAVGAGASTKLVSPVDGKIERIFNFKFPYEYINRFDEIIRRKNEIKEFYNRYA